MNTGFYKDLDTNFEQALEMVEQDFTHEELIRMLMNGNIPQKQIAALMLDYLSDETEANVLLSNLTGCDGKIREAVALRINRFLTETPECAKLFTNAEIFADAIMRIHDDIAISPMFD